MFDANSLPLESLACICRSHGVAGLELFGSAVRGELREDSDIDLLVEFDPGRRVGLIALSRLRRELEDVLGRRVDLVPRAGLKAMIRDQVLGEAEVVFAA